MMRIITGSARGAKLVAPESNHTRPTAERTKEAVFSMLQNAFWGRRVLDLFGGSGQLALEAVSRGAASAVIVDNHKGALDAIRKNVAHTRLCDRVRVVEADAFGYLRTARGEDFSLVFLDPPYGMGLLPRCLSLLAENGVLRAGGLVICEAAAYDEVFLGDAALAARYEVMKQARYGVAHITILRLLEEGSA